MLKQIKLHNGFLLMPKQNIDIEQIEGAITLNTKAISLVHYLGMPVDMDRINAIAKK